MIRRLSLVLLVVAPFLTACSDHLSTPLAPEAPASRLLAPTGVDLAGVLQFAELPNLAANRRAEKFIRAAEGGSVELNGFRIDIPAEALPHDAVITIDLPTDAVHGKRVMAEFGPHGIQFNTPVTISFPLGGVLSTTGAIEVARWENGGWTSLGGSVNADGKTLSSTTPHFSTYSARGKEVMAGG